MKSKIRNSGFGIGLAALAFGAMQSSCCVRPGAIADTLRIQDAYATVEICNSLDLSRESEHFRQECKEANEAYLRLLTAHRTECSDSACGSGYISEAR